MKAKSIHGASASEIKTALENAMADGYKPTLAVVFISIKQDRKAICELLDQKGIDIFGATSCGEFIDGVQTEGEIVMLLMNLSREYYSIMYSEIGNRSMADSAMQFAQLGLKQFPNPSFIMCSTGMTTKGKYFDGETFVQTINKVIGSDRIYFGGMAGDDWTFEGSYLFTNQGETDFGMSALVLDADKISLIGMATTGWKPMGITRKVTKSKGKLLYTIDNKSAVEMYFKYLGQTDRLEDKNFNMFKDLSTHYPFIVNRASGETALRSPMSINHEENALELDIAMPEGTEFWFTVPPDFNIAEEIMDQANLSKAQNDWDADALLIFSCAGRPPVLGPLIALENDGLADVWKAPMAGFFTYGEYGRDSKENQEFHSGACCWVALRELRITNYEL